MRERIKQVMASVFLVAVEDVPDGSAVEALPEWDSLRHIELMLALEAEFEIRIPADVWLQLESFERIEEFLDTQVTAVPK